MRRAITYTLFLFGTLFLCQGIESLLVVRPDFEVIPLNQRNRLRSTEFYCLETLPNSSPRRPKENVFWSLNSKVIDTTGSKYRNFGRKKKLLVRDLNHEDNGVYECALVSNHTRRGRGELWITPDIIMAPESQILQINNDNTVSCIVTGGIRAVEWKKNNRTIAYSNRTIVDNHYIVLNSGSLFISNLAHEDSGRYECIVSNKGGMKSRNIEVMVISSEDNCIIQHESDEEIINTETVDRNSLPHFSIKPPSCIQTTVGFNIILRCSVEARSPSTIITWLKGEDIITGDNEHYMLLPEGSLRINTVGHTDEAIYTCRASTAAHFTIHVMVHLQVKAINDATCGVSWSEDEMLDENNAGNRIRRVVDGVPSHINNWPWQVLLEFTTTPREVIGLGSERFCGGVLLSPDWIATAAHCLHLRNNVDWFTPGQLILRAGVFNRTNKTEQNQQMLEIDYYVIHPDYRIDDISIRDNDIALLKLSHPVRTTKYVSFICLPEILYEDPPVGTLCTVTGWGHLKYGAGSSPDLLHSAQVPIVSRSDCRSGDSYNHNQITPNKLCAGWREGGADSCQNDSGGPLVCRTLGDRWILYGIVNGGRGCGIAHKYGIYARVTRYVEWIESMIR